MCYRKHTSDFNVQKDESKLLHKNQHKGRTLRIFIYSFYIIGTVRNTTTVTSNTMTKAFIRPLGLLMIFLYCTLSGLAGVYNEWILKKQYTESLHIQNIYLYTYGFLLNSIPAVGIPLISSRSFRQMNPFKGFSIYTWLVISTQALNGLFMSVVIKHTSNIVRLFVISFSLIVTTLLSVLVLHMTLNFYFFISCVAMMWALWLYHS